VIEALYKIDVVICFCKVLPQFWLISFKVCMPEIADKINKLFR